MPQQHLAIIISDIKKYSSIRSEKIYSLVNAELDKFIDNYIKKSSNIIYYKKTGDGLIICSTSCLFAANIALLLRDRFLSINWKEEDYHDPVIPRIAAHFGLINVHRKDDTNDDITGVDVIMAARIEPIVSPGAIYCSEDFYNQVTKLPANNTKFVALGETPLAKDYGSFNLYRMHWEHEYTGI